MAQISSNGYMDMRQIDFSVLHSFDYSYFLNNSNVSLTPADLPGITGTYDAEDFAFFSDDPNLDFADPSPVTSPSLVAVGGYNLNVSTGGELLSGRVTGIILSDIANGGYFFAVGFDNSAILIQQASLTVDLADDRAQVNRMLIGDDHIIGSEFTDYLLAGAGDDLVQGNAGADTIEGGNGNDSLYGGSQADSLIGDAGNDLMAGDAGGDRLRGGLGADTLDGGIDNNRDVFFFYKTTESTVANPDEVLHFVSGQDDISLTVIDANTGAAGNQAFAFSTAGAAANSIWASVTGADLLVSGDVNGDSVADFAILFKGIGSVTAGDFLL